MKSTAFEVALGNAGAEIARIAREIERSIDAEVDAQVNEATGNLREEIRAEMRELDLREILDELRPVIELAWRADPSLVEHHLRQLGIDPTAELATVQAEAMRGGRAA